ncbi:MAG: tRNA (adenosine(37)-N6)-threonylcarbamoyltransferase complex transferase subunit TsaD, partial [Acidimicrobiales bacterium]|nr:tRNA (adenosine(37)-N6)-threonylcarbamoyltransferase complex transferase subunit TsaD [Acidimicrobiales bacterium]
VARVMGLGYPGGPAIDRVALTGDPTAIAFPRAMPEGLDFSLSGLKTAVIRYVRDNPETPVADVAASFQAAVVDTLIDKTKRALAEVGAKTVCLGGGVAANSLLRERMLDLATAEGLRCFLPSRSMCTDNAAMVAAAAWWRYKSDGPTSLEVGAQPNLRLA